MDYREENLKLESIIELVQMLNQQSSFEEILRIISTKSIQLFDADSAKVMMLNPQTENTVRTIYERRKEKLFNNYHLLNVNIAGWMGKYNRSFISSDLSKDERFDSDLIKDIGIQSVMCIPLNIGDRSIGSLHLLNQKGSKIFRQIDLQLAEKFCSVVAPFLDKVEEINEYFSCPLPDEDLINKYAKIGLIGKCDRFIDLLKSIEVASKCSVRVLLEGKTGTGKELIARAIHNFSERTLENFSVIDCGAIPESLIESELFGYVKGAFTGAVKDRIGIIEDADNGTLFIDEINNLSMSMQAKFLRLLQEKEYRAVGSNEIKKVNVRIIAASSVPLKILVKEKKFKEELFYRLNVYPINVPSLDERIEDIDILINYFIPIFASEQKKSLEAFNGDLMKILTHRNWEGNIRELENMVERLVTLAPSGNKTIGKDILPKEFVYEMEQNDYLNYARESTLSLNTRLDNIESVIIREELIKNNWNKTKTALFLNIPEQTLRYRMNKLRINKN